MRGGQPGPQPAKSAGPTAKLRASGPRARSKLRPADQPFQVSSHPTHSSNQPSQTPLPLPWTYGNSPLCSTGHRPFRAAALL